MDLSLSFLKSSVFSRWTSGAVLLLLAGSLAWGGSSASGQAPAAAAPAAPAAAEADPGYTVLPYKIPELADPRSREYGRLMMSKGSILSGKALDDATKRELDTWYMAYFFVSMTQPDQHMFLPAKRQELLKDLQAAYNKTPSVHKYLLDTTMRVMKALVTPRFHPAVRYNAMLIIGDLNAKEATVRQRYPDPLPEALPVLVAEYQKPDQIDALRFATLIGLLRHVQLDWARPAAERMKADDKRLIVELTMALIEQKDPPPGRGREGHAWMQHRAVEILGAMGAIDESDRVYKSVETLVADAKNPLSLRCGAARALKFFDDKSRANVDMPLAAYQLTTLASDACKSELARLEKMKNKESMGAMSSMSGDYAAMGMGMGGEGMMPGMAPAGMPMGPGMAPGMAPGMGPGMMPGYGEGGMGMGGMGMGTGVMVAATDPKLVPTQRRLLSQLTQLQEGLNGIRRAAKNPADKGKLDEVFTSVDGVVTLVFGPIPPDKKASARAEPPKKPIPPLTLDSLIKDLKSKITELDRLAQRVAPPSVKPAPAETPELDLPPGVAPEPEKAAGG